MKKAADGAIGVAVVSAIIGIISRLMVKPVAGIFARRFPLIFRVKYIRSLLAI